jgi:hypothetical protein
LDRRQTEVKQTSDGHRTNVRQMLDGRRIDA